MAEKLKNDIFDYNVKLDDIIVDVSINRNDKDVDFDGIIVRD